jgi:hypothetical protein
VTIPRDVAVPATDSADNRTMRDVIGSKSDRTYNGGDSIFAEVHTLGDHFHKPVKVYPTLADGITVTGAAGAWTLGSIVEIIPAATVGDPFDVHFVNIESASATDTYEIVLYQGGAGSRATRTRRAASLSKVQLSQRGHASRRRARRAAEVPTP